MHVFIAYLPALIAFIFIELYSIEKAFLSIYLPILLLFSQNFTAEVQGLPDIAFSQAAILPIGIAFMVKRLRFWKFSITDFLVFGFVSWCAIAVYNVSGYKDAQNMFFFYSVNIFFPYFLAKGLIEPKNLRVRFAKRFAFLLFVNLLIMAHSVVFGFSIHDRLWRHIFPNGMHALWFNYRYGIPRLPASFGHPILAGLVMAIGFRVSRWLQWSKHWERRFRRWHPLGMSKGRIISLGLLFALFLSLSRGPWLAAACGAFFCAAARKKSPSHSLVVRLTLVGVLILAGWSFLQWYVHNVSQGFDTIEYRWKLWRLYREHVFAKPWFGWGVVDWPVIGMQRSVDNYYLYLTVSFGIPASILMMSIMGWITSRTFIRCLMGRVIKPLGSKLAFTLFSIHAIVIVCVGTVWMDSQLLQIYFLVVGWSEGYLLSKKELYRTPRIKESTIED